MRPRITVGEHFDQLPARNLRRYIAWRHHDSVNAFSLAAQAAGHKLNQSTVNRIANGRADTSFSMLQMLADAMGYEVWELVHPDFDPRNMPRLKDPRTLRVAMAFESIQDERDRKIAEALIEQFTPSGLPQPEREPTQALPSGT